jgi:hypothetical protein
LIVGETNRAVGAGETILTMYDNLVGGWPTPLKNMSSIVGMMTFPIYGKIKTCSKPPTCNDNDNVIIVSVSLSVKYQYYCYYRVKWSNIIK